MSIFHHHTRYHRPTATRPPSLSRVLREREITPPLATAPQRFFEYVASNIGVLRRYTLDTELDAHEGCVNTVNWNSNGTLLVSGSDDTHIHLYDVNARRLRLRLPTVHSANIFDAKFVTNTDDGLVVSCSADGVIAVSDLTAETSSVVKGNMNRVKKLALLPEVSARSFLSCDDDGEVLLVDLRDRRTHLLVKHRYSLSSIDVHGHLFVVGGDAATCCVYDHRRVGDAAPADNNRDTFHSLYSDAASERSLYAFHPPVDRRRRRETHLQASDHVTGVCFVPPLDANSGWEVLASYSGREICLYNLNSKSIVQSYRGHVNVRTVKSVNYLHTQHIISGSDDGAIYIWHRATGELAMVIEDADQYVVNCIVGHPHEPLIVCSGIDDTPKLFAPIAARQVSVPDVLSRLGETRANDNSPPFGPAAFDIDALTQLSRVYGMDLMSMFRLQSPGDDDDDDDDDDDNDDLYDDDDDAYDD